MEEEATRIEDSGIVKQQLELPHDSAGQVDWETLGKIATAQILGEVLKSSFVDPLHGQLSRKTEAVFTDWEYCFEQNGVAVFKKKLKSSPLSCFMGRGVIESPLEEIAEVLSHIESTFIWDRFLLDAKYVKILSQSENHKDFIGYFNMKAKKCFVNATRDLCFYARSKLLDDGKYVLTATSVKVPECPLVPGLIRMKLFCGSGWVLEPFRGSRDRTLASYLVHADIVQLPAVISNMTMKRHPMNVYYLRKHLAASKKPSSQPSPSSRRTVTESFSHFDRTPPTGRNASAVGSFLPQSLPNRPYEEPLPVGDFIDYSDGQAMPHFHFRESPKSKNGLCSEDSWLDSSHPLYASGYHDILSSRDIIHESLTSGNDSVLASQVHVPGAMSTDTFANAVPSDGVDWNHLGDETTEKLLQEVSLVSRVDSCYSGPTHGSTQAQDSSASHTPVSPWKFIGTEEDVQLFKKDASGPVNSFAGRGLIDRPLSAVAHVLCEIENTFFYDQFLVEARYVSVLSQSEYHKDYIGYQKFVAKQRCVTATRDFCYFARGSFLRNKSCYVLSGVSVDHPSCQLLHGLSRIKAYAGTGWVLEPYYDDRDHKWMTLVTYIIQADLMDLPLVVLNIISKRQPLNIHYLREHMMKTSSSSRWEPNIAHMPSTFSQQQTGHEEDGVRRTLALAAGRRSTAASVSSAPSVDPLHKLLLSDGNGEVDWNTLGKLLMGDILGEVLCASYIDKKYGEYKDGFLPVTDWRFDYEEQGIQVFRKKNTEPPFQCFMGRGVIDFPLSQVADVLTHIEWTSIYEKFLVEAKYIKILSESDKHKDYIGHQYFVSAKCLSVTRRDLLYFARSIFLEDGRYVLTGISIQHPECPEIPGITRISCNSGTGWVLEPYKGSKRRTLVSYLANVDLKGLHPSVMSTVLQSQALNIHNLRKHLNHSASFSFEEELSASMPLLKPSSHKSTAAAAASARWQTSSETLVSTASASPLPSKFNSRHSDHERSRKPKSKDLGMGSCGSEMDSAVETKPESSPTTSDALPSKDVDVSCGSDIDSSGTKMKSEASNILLPHSTDNELKSSHMESDLKDAASSTLNATSEKSENGKSSEAEAKTLTSTISATNSVDSHSGNSDLESNSTNAEVEPH